MKAERGGAYLQSHTPEAAETGMLQVKGQPGLPSEYWASQDHLQRLSQKKKKKQGNIWSLNFTYFLKPLQRLFYFTHFFTYLFCILSFRFFFLESFYYEALNCLKLVSVV